MYGFLGITKSLRDPGDVIASVDQGQYSITSALHKMRNRLYPLLHVLLSKYEDIFSS